MDNQIMTKQKIILYSILLLFCIPLFISFLLLYIKKPPSIAFPEGTRYDFGTVDEEGLIKHEFLLENQGGSNLEIEDVKTGCGCTSAILTKKLLAPGADAKVIVSYKGRSLNQREKIPIWIISNDPDKPIVQMILTGIVRTKVFWFPKSLSFNCEQGTSNQFREVQCLTKMLGKFEVNKVVTSSDNISVSVDKNEKGIRCKIALNPSCLKGNSTEKVTLEFLINNNVRKVDIPVYLMIH